MRGRIGQRLDHLVEFDHRTRPAMGDDQRHRLGMLRADVQEVNAEPVDLGGELRKAIEFRLARAPVIFLGPIAADILDPLQRRALAPVVDQFGLRPARVAQPRLEIVEHVVADRNAIGFYFCIHGHFFRCLRARVVRAHRIDTTGDTGFRKPSAINIAAAADKPSIVEVQIPQFRRKRRWTAQIGRRRLREADDLRRGICVRCRASAHLPPRSPAMPGPRPRGSGPD